MGESRPGTRPASSRVASSAAVVLTVVVVPIAQLLGRNTARWDEVASRWPAGDQRVGDSCRGEHGGEWCVL